MNVDIKLLVLGLLLLFSSTIVWASASFTCETKDIHNGIIGPPGRPGKSGPPGEIGKPGESILDPAVMLKIEELERNLSRVIGELSRQNKILENYQAELNRVGAILVNLDKGQAPSQQPRKPRLPPPRPMMRTVSPPGKPRSCAEVTRGKQITGTTAAGTYVIYPSFEGSGMQVFCDMSTDGGGWLVFQRRFDGSVSFHKSWAEYVDGFGSPSGEFWLGLETLHKLTKTGKWKLRIDVSDWENVRKFAEFSDFKVGSSATDFTLTLDGYSGDAGDSFTYHSGHKFTTFDKDNDPWVTSNCATIHKGGWWFYKCANSNLNGLFHEGGSYVDVIPNGIFWKEWRGFRYSLKTTEMKIKLVS